jgi:hypothetical protein
MSNETENLQHEELPEFEQDVHQQDEQEVEASGESEVEGTLEEEPKKTLPPEAQVAFGKALKAERERIRAQERARVEAEYQQRLQYQNQNANQNLQEGMIFDPETGEHVDVNSPVGQMLVRNHKAAQLKTLKERAAENESLQDKVSEGFSRYEDFAEHRDEFVRFGTNAMAEALKGCKDAAGVVNFLGKHSEELKRIARLSPIEQVREVFMVESRLNPPKRLVSKAAEPPRASGETRRFVKSNAEQSIEDRVAFYRSKESRVKK